MAQITGTSGNDELVGTDFDDVIDGMGGNDIIDAGDGQDFVTTLDGTDIVHGGGAGDFLTDYGGDGALYGEDNRDNLQVDNYVAGTTMLADGGADNDQFYLSVGESAAVTAVGGHGSDTLHLRGMMGTLEISLGGSRDIVHFFEQGMIGYRTFSQYRTSGITITDFAPGGVGASGDVIDWDHFLAVGLTGWDQSANPFSTGHLRLVQSGTDTLVQADPDGGGDEYATLLILADVAKSSLVAANFDGYDPTGAPAVDLVIDGTDADERLVADVGNDVMRGFAGVDDLLGGGGNDEIEGGDGADWMFGQVGHDELTGGDDGDVMSGGTGDDRMFGEAGDDRLFGEEGDDLVEGGEGDDLLTGDLGADTLYGGDGNDELYEFGPGTSLLDGGDGNDDILLESPVAASSTILGGAGDDTIRIDLVSAGLIEVDAGAGADRVEVTRADGAMPIALGSGIDTLAFRGDFRGYIGSGIVVSDFEAGPWGDRIDWGDFLTMALVGWDGEANPFTEGYLRVVQDEAATLLQLNPVPSHPQAEFITIAVFDNVVAADLSTENLGYSPIPAKGGTAGPDNIVGKSYAERLVGLAGDDQIAGLGGDDLILGGDGDDELDGGSGADRMFGGDGDDLYIVDTGADRLYERDGHGVDAVQSSATFALADFVDHLTLTGTAAIDGTGNGLANTITGNGAANLLIGGDGDDTLNGAGGIDEMRGGEDDDLYVVDHFSDRIVELAGQGVDSVRSSASYILSDHVESLTLTGGGNVNASGNALANTITGNNGNNRLDGRAGADTLAGGAGHDTYVVNYSADQVIEAGSSGNDTVESAVSYTLPIHVEKLILTGSFGYDGRGNAGANTIAGNAGANFLNGGSGNDIIDAGAGKDDLMGHLGQDSLRGGSGDDRFFFNMAPGAANADDILDFAPADDAVYLLRSAFAGAGPNGTLAASAFHNGAAAADANDRILYDAATGNLFYDADGTGAAAAILFASVAAGTALTHADFVIYG